MKRIRCLLMKELAQLRRDRRLVSMLLVAPVVQLLVLGFAANPDVRDIDLAIRDNDHTYHSRELTRALSASDYFKTTALVGPAAEDNTLFVSGKAGLIVVIPRGFGERLVRRQPATVQALVDGADSNFAVQGVNYLQKATRLFSDRLVRLTANSVAPSERLALPSVVAESRAWYNPDLTSRRFMVPGIMALLLMVATMLVTSMALVKEREDGTMEQLIVTPLRPGELIAGKLLPFVVVGFAEVTFAVLVIRFVFGIPWRGSLTLLYGMSGLFLLTTLGLGLLVSTLVKTQQQAMMVSTFFVMMPFVLLSGFAFPVANMPPLIQGVAELIPLKYYLTILRGIFLKGAGMAELWPQALALLLWGVVILTLAAKMFHKRLD
jgi:ABC-2 type transport system permease protein